MPFCSDRLIRVLWSIDRPACARELEDKVDHTLRDQGTVRRRQTGFHETSRTVRGPQLCKARVEPSDAKAHSCGVPVDGRSSAEATTPPGKPRRTSEPHRYGAAGG